MEMPIVPYNTQIDGHDIVDDQTIHTIWVWSYTSDYPAGIDVNIVNALISPNFGLANIEEMLPPGIFLHEKHRFCSEDPIFDFNFFISDYARRKMRKRSLALEEIFDNIQRGTLIEGAKALLKEMEDEKTTKKYKRFAEIFRSQQASYREIEDKIIRRLIPLDDDESMLRDDGYDEEEVKGKLEGKEEKKPEEREGKKPEKVEEKKAKPPKAPEKPKRTVEGKEKDLPSLKGDTGMKKRDRVLGEFSGEEEDDDPVEILRTQRDEKLKTFTELGHISIEQIKEKLAQLRKQREAILASQIANEDNERLNTKKEEDEKKEARRLEKEKKKELLEKIAKLGKKALSDKSKISAKSSASAKEKPHERNKPSDNAPKRKLSEKSVENEGKDSKKPEN